MIAEILRDFDMQHLASIFAAASAVIAALTIPYNFVALLIWERHPTIRYVRSNRHAYYRPSLQYLTWLDQAFFIALVIIMFNYALRVYFHLEPSAAPAEPQPAWSYALSMFSTAILLALFALPSAFLFHVKRQIKEAEDLDAAHPLVPPSREANDE